MKKVKHHRQLSELQLTTKERALEKEVPDKVFSNRELLQKTGIISAARPQYEYYNFCAGEITTPLRPLSPTLSLGKESLTKVKKKLFQSTRADAFIKGEAQERNPITCIQGISPTYRKLSLQQSYSLTSNSGVVAIGSQSHETTKKLSPKPDQMNVPKTPSNTRGLLNRKELLKQDREKLLKRRLEEFADYNEKKKITKEDREKLYSFFKNPHVNAQIAFHRYWIDEKHIWISEDKDQIRFLKEKDKVRKYYDQFKPFDNKKILTPQELKTLDIANKMSTLEYLNKGNNVSFGTNFKSRKQRDYIMQVTRLESQGEGRKDKAEKDQIIDDKTMKKMQRSFFTFRNSRHEDRYQIAKSLSQFLNRIYRIGFTLDELTTKEIFSVRPYQKNGSFAFFAAVKKDNMKLVDDLLSNCRYLVFDFDEFGRTALHWACLKEYDEMVEYLLEKKSEIDVTDMGNKSPLQMAIEASNLRIVKILLYHHASPWCFGKAKFYDLTDNNEIKKLLKSARQIDFLLRMSDPRSRRLLWNHYRELYFRNRF